MSSITPVLFLLQSKECLFMFNELLVGLNLPGHSLALCLCARGPDCAGSGSPPPHPERSEVSLLVINRPGRDRLRKEKKT